VQALLDSAVPTREEIAKTIFNWTGKARVQGIKDIRQKFGLGLKEAKMMSDEYFQTGKIIWPGDLDEGGEAHLAEK
jgi:ribosomal protein L7/L12